VLGPTAPEVLAAWPDHGPLPAHSEAGNGKAGGVDGSRFCCEEGNSICPISGDPELGHCVTASFSGLSSLVLYRDDVQLESKEPMVPRQRGHWTPAQPDSSQLVRASGAQRASS
jgi:hypothetical protein